MKKHLLFLITILLFVSCESETENIPFSFSSGYVILNQGSAASTLTASTAGHTVQSAYELVNNKGIGVFGNEIVQASNYIYVPMANDFKVRVLDKTLKEIATIETFKVGFSPQYVSVFSNYAAVLWTKLNWTSPELNVYTLKIYDISKIDNDKVTELHSVELDGYRPIINDEVHFYTASATNLHKVNAQTGALTSNALSTETTDLTLLKNTLYLSFVDYKNVTEATRDLSGGFLKYSTDLTRLDSINTGKAIYKLASSETDIFTISVSGNEKFIQHDGWSEWKLETFSTSLQKVASLTLTTLFTSEKLKALATSNQWVRFKYIAEQQLFFVPDFENYTSNGSINLFTEAGQISETIEAGVAPVNAVYITK